MSALKALRPMKGAEGEGAAGESNRNLRTKAGKETEVKAQHVSRSLVTGPATRGPLSGKLLLLKGRP